MYCVSFFIFRTGSVLIVGRCTEAILYQVHQFIVGMLETERSDIEMKESADTKHTHVLQSKTKRAKGKGGAAEAFGRVTVYRTKQTI